MFVSFSLHFHIFCLSLSLTFTPASHPPRATSPSATSNRTTTYPILASPAAPPPRAPAHRARPTAPPDHRASTSTLRQHPSPPDLSLSVGFISRNPLPTPSKGTGFISRIYFKQSQVLYILKFD